MKAFNHFSVLSVVTLIWGKQGVAQQQCVDSKDFFYKDGKRKIKCEKVLNVGKEYCAIAKVQSQCPSTCGKCCEDDESYRLKRPDGLKTCTWVRETQQKKDEWCDRYNNGSIVRNACPVACGKCCGDDPDYSFKASGKQRKCQWLNNQNRKDNWCSSWANGSAIKKACRVKCGDCCADDPDFSFKADGENRKCQWLSNKTMKEKWCGKVIDGNLVSSVCRIKCGDCCAEDPDYSFRIDGGGKKTCAWLSTKERRDKWCDTWINGNYVMNTCPIRCGECCGDDPDYSFKKNGRNRDCHWLSRQTPKIHSIFCSKVIDEVPLKNSCMKTCGICTSKKTDSPAAPPPSPANPPVEPPTSPLRPNVLIILTDDVGVGDIKGYWDDGIVDMPNIKKLMNHGTKFMNVHSTPLCATSRYVLLSGNYQFRGKGVWKLGNDNSFKQGQMSIAEVMKTKGYNTAAMGKWHLGAKIQPNGLQGAYNHILSDSKHNFRLPVSFGAKFLGFDSSLITYSGIQGPPYSFFRNDYLDTNSIKFWSEGEHKMSDGTSVIRKQGEGAPEWDSTKHDRILVEETKDFLDDHMKHRADDPFFLYFSTGGVHTPHTPTKDFSGQYPTPHMDMLSEMDNNVGVLIEELEERDLLENTIVIFTSDNGGMNALNTGSGVYGHNSSGKLRDHKGSSYEGGHRVPFIMRFDGVIPAGNTEDSLIGQNDLFATLCDILDIEIPSGQALDSMSFADLLIEDSSSRENYKRREHLGIWRMDDKGRNIKHEAILTSKFKLIHYPANETVELYNLIDDLSETTDLSSYSSQYKKVAKDLLTELKRIGPN